MVGWIKLYPKPTKPRSLLIYSRACLFRKWLKMVFIPLLRFGGSFGLQIYFAGAIWRKPHASYNPSTRARPACQTSPYRTEIGKRRIKTILDQFRNKHARYESDHDTTRRKPHKHAFQFVTVWSPREFRENRMALH